MVPPSEPPRGPQGPAHHGCYFYAAAQNVSPPYAPEVSPTRPRPPRKVVRALALRLKQLREERGWSQEKLSEESEIHRTFIAGVEVGKRNPSLATLARLADALGVEIKDLFE